MRNASTSKTTAFIWMGMGTAMIQAVRVALLSLPIITGLAGAAFAQEPLACTAAGPQTPRDITEKAGSNPDTFALAPASSRLNLCNIHFHTSAEHRGPGFLTPARGGAKDGWTCNEAAALTPAELAPSHGHGCHGLKAGDTIEVHWVHSSCPVKPGKGLGSCLAGGCEKPVLRVEAQVFLVVNSRAALDFAAFDYSGAAKEGLHQAKALPSDTGTPVVFRGSTTGPSYDADAKCSPLKATWSVRPACAKVDIETVHAWCEKNAFEENHAHGVRPIVTRAGLLDRIE